MAGIDLLNRIKTILDYTGQIVNVAAPGLNATVNSVAYVVAEVERHLHSYERWFEKASVPVGETHTADRVGSGVGAFQIDAGNDNWGPWTQILGSDDTSESFDPHRIQIEAVEHNETYFFQLAFGDSGAAALAADTYTESVYTPATSQVEEAPVDVRTRRHDAGTKVWARCMCPGQNTGTFDFYIGLHYYEG